ncbi:MAG: ribosome recycling factor, partial [Cyclobacteriaceae bacterium]
MEEIEMYLDEAKDQMNKALAHVSHELTKIRAGKANPSMLEGILVSYYGAMTPLQQVSSMTTPDARTIFIKPWEKGLIQEIEKSIMNANLGLTPQNDGQQVIINVPMLTEERRRQLVKQVSQECEQGKVSIRSI